MCVNYPNYLAAAAWITKGIWPDKILMSLGLLEKEADNKHGFTDKDIEDMIKLKEEMTWNELEEYYQIPTRTLLRYKKEYQKGADQLEN